MESFHSNKFCRFNIVIYTASFVHLKIRNEYLKFPIKSKPSNYQHSNFDVSVDLEKEIK